jgi:Aspartyl protease
VTVPVRVGDVEIRFGLDTGIGLNLISAALAEQVGCQPDGSTFTGRRMSGQEVAQRAQHGTGVPVQVEHDHCSTDLVLGIDLPGGRAISAEVDTGSDALVLDVTLAGEAGVDLAAPGTRVYESTDETGYKFTRYFATVCGEVSLTAAPEFRVTGPEALFQKIIYDGLIGDQFLRNFVTTYDLAGSRMIFAPPLMPDA